VCCVRLWRESGSRNQPSVFSIRLIGSLGADSTSGPGGSTKGESIAFVAMRAETWRDYGPVVEYSSLLWN
jgi:hypothetical protein